ncbi:hypothetical protein C0J52_16951 [Blattella germanica]|nr:hypothetical protein C0J52_16951 [Blattella germanica]
MKNEYQADNQDFDNAFQYCLNTEQADSFGNTIHCMKKEFLINIAHADENESVEVLNGVSLLRDENDKAPRTVFPVYTNSYGSILESVAAFVGRRFIKWDMSLIHPGLIMRVGPFLNGAGVLEFVMERGHPTYSDRTIGTVVSKKALVLSKFAVLLASVVGVNSFSNLHQQQTTHNPVDNVLGTPFFSTFPRLHDYHNEENTPYESYFNDDQLPTYRSPDEGDQTSNKKGRNFAWEKTQR